MGGVEGMDAAIAKMAKTTAAATIARLHAIREAQQNVRPWVPDVDSLAPQPSAEAVYRLALDTMGVNVKGLHRDALWPILKVQPKPGDEERRQRPRVAMDSAADADFAERFPGALLLKNR
jgi:uncharacterized protein